MRVLSFEVQNIMRLSTFFYAFPEDEAVTIIGGKNGHGKSSALNALAMAIGGKKLCPAEPLKRGQNQGFVTVDLDDYIVTRRFWRKETFACEVDHQHTHKCEVMYGDVDSSLTIKSRDGEQEYKSPQQLLNKVYSDLTFDPLSFLDLQPRDQREMVRSFTGIDFTILDTQRTDALARVAEANGVLKLAQRDAENGEHYPDAPTVPMDVAGLLAQLAGAERLQAAATTAEKAVDDKRRAVSLTQTAINEKTTRLAELRAEIARLESAVEADTAHREALIREGKALGEAAKQATAAVPDTSKLRDEIANANDVNAQIAANQRYDAIVTAKQEAENALGLAHEQIATIDAKKVETLSRATFPVPGLAFTDDGLTFDGLPFEQASYAQQLRVAVAMGLAYKPKLKLLLIKHGNALDHASLQLLDQLATEAGAQVIVERVAESPDGVSIFIEDGVGVPVPAEVV